MIDEPTSTHRIFQHDRVAAGYASARPFLHPEVFARVREVLQPAARASRALDVGCGTGLSSVALRELADAVVGVDASKEMLRRASRAAGVRYVACEAESLPFGDGSFDLAVACGSIDWVDLSRFLPRAARVVRNGGWLVSLDFGDTGRSPDIPGLARWYVEVFEAGCPRPPARDPIITAEEAGRHGFGAPSRTDLLLDPGFTAVEYAAFLLTESNIVAAIEYGGHSEGELRAWLDSELEPLFGGQSRRVTFGGYIQALRRQ